MQGIVEIPQVQFLDKMVSARCGADDHGESTGVALGQGGLLVVVRKPVEVLSSTGLGKPVEIPHVLGMVMDVPAICSDTFSEVSMAVGGGGGFFFSPRPFSDSSSRS